MILPRVACVVWLVSQKQRHPWHLSRPADLLSSQNCQELELLVHVRLPRRFLTAVGLTWWCRSFHLRSLQKRALDALLRQLVPLACRSFAELWCGQWVSTAAAQGTGRGVRAAGVLCQLKGLPKARGQNQQGRLPLCFHQD